jgi:hypothetical protein
VLPDTVVIIKVGWIPEGETGGGGETRETIGGERTRRYERAKEDDGE